MTDPQNVKIMAFVGLAGSGKSTAVEYFTAQGFPKVHFGNVIIEAMEKAGIERTQESEKAFRETFRATHGKDMIANQIVTQIEHLIDAGQHRIIADGLYTWTEYSVLKHAFPGEIQLVAIVAPRHVRYHRLAQRLVRPLTSNQAYDRDMTDIETLEIAGPIAIADHYLLNDASIESFHDKLDRVAEELSFT